MMSDEVRIYFNDILARHREASFLIVSQRSLEPDPSDIDVMVYYEHIDRPRYCANRLGSIPTAEFHHDFETLLFAIRSECSTGSAALASLTAYGEPFPSAPAPYELIRKQALRIVQGPPPRHDAARLSREIFALRRMLSVPRHTTERAAVAVSVYMCFVHNFLMWKGHWGGGSPKHFDRTMRSKFPDIHEALQRGMSEAFEGQPQTLLATLDVWWHDVARDCEPYPFEKKFPEHHRIAL